MIVYSLPWIHPIRAHLTLVFAFRIIHTKTLVNVLMISQNIRFKAIYVRSKTFICIYWLAIPIYTYIRLERIFLVLYIIRWSHWFYDSWRSYLIFFWYIALYYLNNTDSMILMQNCIWSIYSFLQREFVDYNPHWFYDSCATCQFMLKRTPFYPLDY